MRIRSRSGARARASAASLALVGGLALCAGSGCQTTHEDATRIGPNEYLVVGAKEGFLHFAPAIWHLKDGKYTRVRIEEK